MTTRARPAVSIIVAVYRTPPDLLRRFLRSALRQTCPDLELIAVDDASPDTCPRVLDTAAAADARMVVLHRATNGGAGAARNDGLAVATGAYVLFADADDRLRADMCETLLRVAADRGADIVACAWTCRDAEGGLLRTQSLASAHYDVREPRQRARAMASLNFALWNKLFLRDTISGLRFASFDANIGEDLVFIVEALCRSHAVATTSYCGYDYTVHAASSTGRAAKGMPYLRALIASTSRVRELLRASGADPALGRGADHLALKRYSTGCAWIAGTPEPAERAALWAYWQKHLREELLPSLNQRGALACAYALIARWAGPGTTDCLTRKLVALIGKAKQVRA